MQTNANKTKEKRTKSKKTWHELQEYEKPTRQQKRKREKSVEYGVIV